MIEIIMHLIEKNGILLSFLGGFVTGESGIIALSFLSANGLLPWWNIIVFCTLGMYLSDYIPLLIGRIKFIRKILKKVWFSRKIKIAEKLIYKYTKHNLFLILLYTKFIYGASIPALMYIGFKKVSYRKFAFYNLLVELIFVPFLFCVGWLGGKGFSLATTILKDIRIAIFLLIVFIVILVLVKKWVNQLLIRRRKK